MTQEQSAGCTAGRAAKFFQFPRSLEEPRGPLDIAPVAPTPPPGVHDS